MALILIIDDEFSVAEVLEAILTDAGHEVVTASNGRQGLERAKEKRPNLVLLDFMMPIMSGGIVNLTARGMLVVSVARRLGSEGPLLAYCAAPL